MTEPYQFAEDAENSQKIPWVLGRWPQTNQELWLFVKAVWGVEIPYKAVCEHHVAPFQAFADAYFARYPVAIWEGSRGFSGKTFTLGLLSCTEMLTLRCFVTILGGSAEQSLRVHEAMQQFLDSDSTPVSVKNMIDIMTRYDTRLANGAKARTLMASQKSVRGPHPQRLRLDEVDEMDWELFKSAQGQPMRSRKLPNVDTQTVASSTHQYPDGCVGAETKVLTNRGEIFIVDVRIDDLVMTRSGFRPVEKIVFSGFKQVVEVEFSNGRKLICTDDHKIATPDGWNIPRWMKSGDEVIGVASDFVVSQPSTRIGGLAKSSSAPSGLSPGLNSLTGLTQSGTPIIESGIFGGELMTVDAMGFATVNSSGASASKNIGLLSHGFDMVDTQNIDTCSDSANMVKFIPVRDRANETEPSPTISGAMEIFSVNPSVSLSLGSVPNPTPVTVDSAPGFEPVKVVSISHTVRVLQPVYDLQVADVHEFIGDGIVVHNTMTKLKETAHEKGWPIYKWCYKETSNMEHGGWLDPQEVDRKRREISNEMWKMEYDLLEPSFEGRAIDTEAVARMFDPDLGVYKGVPQKNHEFEEPRPDRDYITGVDWAQSQDWTVVWTWDTTTLPWKCVAFQRCKRMPWPIIIKFASMRLSRWGGKFIHDATGIGSVVKDMIDIPSGLSPRDVRDEVLGGKNRTNMLSEYVAAIERNEFKCPRIIWAYDEHRFATNEHLYGRLHLPDSICAGALAWSMRKKGLQRHQIAAPDVSDATKRDGGVSPWKLV